MPSQPSPSRLEAFSDGVIAVIITIMVLEFKVPQQNGPAGLLSLAPTLLVYLLSFVFVGIYWINHHHVVDRLKHIDSLVSWANLAFLFALSLLPFFTNYIAVKQMDSFSMAIYCGLLMTIGSMFLLLQRAIRRNIFRSGRAETETRHELNLQAAELRKGQISMGIYMLGIGLAYVRPMYALAAAALVSVIWIVPSFGVHDFED